MKNATTLIPLSALEVETDMKNIFKNGSQLVPQTTGFLDLFLIFKIFVFKKGNVLMDAHGPWLSVVPF
jgi:hypothetical protein